MANINDLPGRPTKKLVKDVRRTLWLYCRCRPQLHDEAWRLAWAWAAQEAEDSLLYQTGRRRRMRWPAGNQIASRYLLLCLSKMEGSCLLNVGLRAAKTMPASVRGYLAAQAEPLRQIGRPIRGPLALLTEDPSTPLETGVTHANHQRTDRSQERADP